jgi:1,4-dihydroxy-2-naphthoate octaprenyltransferase
MATRKQWIEGARPRTLPAAIAPVLVGCSIAYYENNFVFAIALLALVVSLALQIGVNYSNDYSDGIRGTDENRVGPVRLVGQKLASPSEVKKAAFLTYGIGALAGLGMVALSGYYLLLPVGLAAIVAAWFYTGGPRPYGYAGFGEVFVFVFFGLVAVIGTSASQTGHITTLSILAGCGCGLLSTAILIVNNLRDIPGDTRAGKRTLAVRMGDANTRKLYLACIAVAGLLPIAMSVAGHNPPAQAIVGVFALVLALKPFRTLRSGALGRDLIPVLADTGKLLMVYAILLSVGIAISSQL